MCLSEFVRVPRLVRVLFPIIVGSIIHFCWHLYMPTNPTAMHVVYMHGCVRNNTSQWRHMSVMTSQITDCLFNSLLKLTSDKSSPASLTVFRANHSWPMDSPKKGRTAESVFMLWRHHELSLGWINALSKLFESGATQNLQIIKVMDLNVMLFKFKLMKNKKISRILLGFSVIWFSFYSIHWVQCFRNFGLKLNAIFIQFNSQWHWIKCWENIDLRMFLYIYIYVK